MVCDCMSAADGSWLLPYICTPILVSDDWEAEPIYKSGCHNPEATPLYMGAWPKGCDALVVTNQDWFTYIYVAIYNYIVALVDVVGHAPKSLEPNISKTMQDRTTFVAYNW